MPSSGNTARYNWEEIIAEINKQKEQKTDTAEAQPVAAVPAEEPAAEAEQPEVPEQPAERRTLRREREPKKSGSKGVIIALVAVIVVAALLLVLKSTGVLTSLFQKEEPVEEAPELPVEQNVDCTGISLSVNELAITGLGNTATLQATVEPGAKSSTVMIPPFVFS